jgi:hypothetical protein
MERLPGSSNESSNESSSSFDKIKIKTSLLETHPVKPFLQSLKLHDDVENGP